MINVLIELFDAESIGHFTTSTLNLHNSLTRFSYAICDYDMQSDAIIRSPCGAVSMVNWFSLRRRSEFNNSSNLKNKARVVVNFGRLLIWSLNVENSPKFSSAFFMVD